MAAGVIIHCEGVLCAVEEAYAQGFVHVQFEKDSQLLVDVI
jgi:hypothetical protein